MVMALITSKKDTILLNLSQSIKKAQIAWKYELHGEFKVEF